MNVARCWEEVEAQLNEKNIFQRLYNSDVDSDPSLFGRRFVRSIMTTTNLCVLLMLLSFG